MKNIIRSGAVFRSEGSPLNPKDSDLRDSGCWRMRTMSV